MDFTNAQLPTLTPLKNSVAQSNHPIEDDLRNLFIELFSELMASDVFDANVLGMAHLGSLDLVRKAINYDGLVLLEGDREETATRYLYRAWKSRNGQGRGTHFLRTYLQLLFPNAFSLDQLFQEKDVVYPNALSTVESDTNYLTSRIKVLLDIEKVNSVNITKMIPVLRAIVPARLVMDVGIIPISMTAVFTDDIDAFVAIHSAPQPYVFGFSASDTASIGVGGRIEQLYDDAQLFNAPSSSFVPILFTNAELRKINNPSVRIASHGVISIAPDNAVKAEIITLSALAKVGFIGVVTDKNIDTLIIDGLLTSSSAIKAIGTVTDTQDSAIMTALLSSSSVGGVAVVYYHSIPQTDFTVDSALIHADSTHYSIYRDQ